MAHENKRLKIKKGGGGARLGEEIRKQPGQCIKNQTCEKPDVVRIKLIVALRILILARLNKCDKRHFLVHLH